MQFQTMTTSTGSRASLASTFRESRSIVIREAEQLLECLLLSPNDHDEAIFQYVERIVSGEASGDLLMRRVLYELDCDTVYRSSRHAA